VAVAAFVKSTREQGRSSTSCCHKVSSSFVTLDRPWSGSSPDWRRKVPIQCCDRPQIYPPPQTYVPAHVWRRAAGKWRRLTSLTPQILLQVDKIWRAGGRPLSARLSLVTPRLCGVVTPWLHHHSARVTQLLKTIALTGCACRAQHWHNCRQEPG